MSYREIRNFTEIMRSLNYPRTISLQNFFVPNFKLVAEILFWLVRRFDPKYDISDNIEDEKARIKFIKQCCGFFYQQLNLELNPKKLYSSDSMAVPELLKISEKLFKAKKQLNLMLILNMVVN